jgi:hypothetical protein
VNKNIRTAENLLSNASWPDATGLRRPVPGYARRLNARAATIMVPLALLGSLVGSGFTSSVALAADAAAPASAAPATPPWETTVNTETRYFSWTSGRAYPTSVAGSGSGSELYTPFGLQLRGQPNDDFNVEFLARGGWVWARQNSPNATGSVNTSTDTTASGTVTYLGFNGIQPFVAVNLNLPTGRSELFGSAASARMDADLVDIATFGEGFNIGPTVGVNIPIRESLIATLSAGYTDRGSYQRESSLYAVSTALSPTPGPSTVKPGNVSTINASLSYQGQALVAQIAGSVSWETATSENGVTDFRAGTSYSLTGFASYTWANSWRTTVNGSWSFSNKNDVLPVGLSSLAAEVLNSNANVYRVSVEHMFPWGKLTIGPLASFLFRDRNSFDPLAYQFVPAKERWSVGGAASYPLTDQLMLNTRVEYVWTSEDTNPANDNGFKFDTLSNSFIPGLTIPQVSSIGWMLSGGASYKF